jgi:hypothetical protein
VVALEQSSGEKKVFHGGEPFNQNLRNISTKNLRELEEFVINIEPEFREKLVLPEYNTVSHLPRKLKVLGSFRRT